MTVMISDTTDVRYYLIKVVDGVEVRRTELKLERDTLGRFVGKKPRFARGRTWSEVTPDTLVTCPKCGCAFRVGKRKK